MQKVSLAVLLVCAMADLAAQTLCVRIQGWQMSGSENQTTFSHEWQTITFPAAFNIASYCEYSSLPPYGLSYAYLCGCNISANVAAPADCPSECPKRCIDVLFNSYGFEDIYFDGFFINNYDLYVDGYLFRIVDGECPENYKQLEYEQVRPQIAGSDNKGDYIMDCYYD
jgi:hypothetical protein